jgi:hypothetical protein
MTVFSPIQQHRVAEGTRATSATYLSPAFNDFLYAPIADDGHGMPLSVLSALARLGVDPWQEAATLAGLPGEAAIQRLTTLIAELPGGTLAHPGPATNIAALIAYLPRRAGSAIAPSQGLFDAGARSRSLAIAYVLFMILMMGTQWIAANHESAAPDETGRTAGAALAAPPTPSSSAIRR